MIISQQVIVPGEMLRENLLNFVNALLLTQSLPNPTALINIPINAVAGEDFYLPSKFSNYSFYKVEVAENIEAIERSNTKRISHVENTIYIFAGNVKDGYVFINGNKTKNMYGLYKLIFEPTESIYVYITKGENE